MKKEVIIEGKTFQAELVSSIRDRQKGLGDRQAMPENEAMVFIFEEKGIYSFWMKDMLFDLDIIWVENKKIVYIAQKVSHLSLASINPGILADQVIEINSGLVEKYSFKIGDSVEVR